MAWIFDLIRLTLNGPTCYCIAMYATKPSTHVM